jgi:DNA-binding response OmpR family regulator
MDANTTTEDEQEMIVPAGNEQAGGRATPEQMVRKHVYVVNGSPEFLDIVRQLLQDENYNVTTTNFVPLSFETIEAAQPSLLIVDLVLGEIAGWNLLAQLREAISTRDIPVLLISTSPKLLVEAQEKHEEFGGDRYLVKPFDLDDLLTLIDELIGAA